MKRGLIAWDKTELPPEAFDSRLSAARALLAQRGLPALIVYTDLWRSNQARHFSNFMPYFNRAFLVIPREGAPLLLCGLSPRVYPWIKSVTILPEILPSPNLPQRLLQVCSDRGWIKLGLLDFDQFPYDLHTPLLDGIQCVNLPQAEVHPMPDQWEIAMHARAAAMAREGLAAELPLGPGLTDYEFTGRLERRLRRAGAEDLIVLLTNGDTPPAPARGDTLRDGFSAILSLEYRGHWAKVGRTQGSAAPPHKATLQILSGPLSYEGCRGDVPDGAVVAQLIETVVDGRLMVSADTFRKTDQGLQLL